MKESIGGAMMLRMFIVAIVLLVAFLAISVSYARAFRVKNRIIDILEEYEGYTEQAADLINNYMDNMGYSCDVEHVVESKDELGNGVIYHVATCVNWEIPVFNIANIWKVRGQTELIRHPASDILEQEVIKNE